MLGEGQGKVIIVQVWAVVLSVGKRCCLGRKKRNLQAPCQIQNEKADEEFCIMNKKRGSIITKTPHAFL